MTTKNKPLQRNDINTLLRMLYMEDYFGAGIYGNYSHLSKLERHGLIIRSHRTEGFCDIDGEKIGDRWVFRLTPEGLEEARRHD